jgi:hypothetical protein
MTYKTKLQTGLTDRASGRQDIFAIGLTNGKSCFVDRKTGLQLCRADWLKSSGPMQTLCVLWKSA